jgi:hypothetical protein
MKRVIFTTYDDINDADDKWNILSFQQNQINDYFDRLVKNKQDYAESIGVKFILFYNTMGDFDVDAGLEFTKVNLYKHRLMAELAEEFDEVMYVDMDVIFNTSKNVFEELDLSKGIYIKDQDSAIENKINEEIIYSQIGNRNPTLKYHITKDLLGGKDCHVMNTGVVIAKSSFIKQIKYVDRLPELIEKVNSIKLDSLKNNTATFLRMYYYPNNESLFSYILENYEIPYVLMEDKWHKIISDDPEELNWEEIEVAHIINKKFNAFFKDKTKAIFSIYIEIPDDRLDNPRGPIDDPVNKSKRTKDRLSKYKERLYENHIEYAKSVGAKYLHFNRDEQYEQFFKRFPDLSEYDVINLYKVYLLNELTKEYDLVLYVDLDVYFVNNNIDVFNYMKGEHCLACNAESAEESGVRIKNKYYFEDYNKDFRNPQSKYWNAHALLKEEDFNGDNLVFNTGIMMASRKVMEQLDYFSDIEDVIDTMKELKEFSMYPENIQKAFGYDNETIMAYKVVKNNVPVYRLPDFWHWKHDYGGLKTYENGHSEFNKARKMLESKIAENNVQLVHFISKNFGLVFDD